MKIKLSEIQPATPRVRKELNLDALDELAESIKETGGVIVPVKLRKNGDGYTTVYGHRRIEAARIAGFKEIEAFIEDVDDSEVLTQALIENVVREDMKSVDIAKALKQVRDETGWTQEQLGTKFGMGREGVAMYLRMLEPTFKKVVDAGGPALTPTHIREAKAGTSDDADAVKILEKAAKEGLSQKQTRTVAEEYKKAKQFSTKSASAVLRTPFEELGLRQFVPTTKPTRTVARTVSPPAKKTKAFSWVRDPNIIKAGELLKGMQVTIGDINSIVNFIEVNKEREPKQLPHIKKQLTAHLSKRIGEMKDIIARLEEI